MKSRRETRSGVAVSGGVWMNNQKVKSQHNAEYDPLELRDLRLHRREMSGSIGWEYTKKALHAFVLARHFVHSDSDDSGELWEGELDWKEKNIWHDSRDAPNTDIH